MKIRPVHVTILLTALVLPCLAASCATTNNYPPPNYPPGGGYPGGGYPGGGGGGGYGSSRILITEGEGRVAWNADQNGDVYIYNARQNRLLFNGPVRRGDQIEVEPWQDRILINNQPVFRQNMERSEPHAIYFERFREPPPGRGGRGGNYPWYREGVIITEGDDRLAWNADENGQVYVYDYGEDKLVWNGPIQRGQRIEVLPAQDRITINDRPVYTSNLRRNARHQIVLVKLPGDNRGGRGGPGRGGPPPQAFDPIPQGARQLVEGTGDIAIGQAPNDGVVWVYDDTDRRVIYSTEIGRNNSFQIFPRENYVNLNSRKHADVRFTRGHRHSLYFRAR